MHFYKGRQKLSQAERDSERASRHRRRGILYLGMTGQCRDGTDLRHRHDDGGAWQIKLAGDSFILARGAPRSIACFSRSCIQNGRFSELMSNACRGCLSSVVNMLIGGLFGNNGYLFCLGKLFNCLVHMQLTWIEKVGQSR